MAENPIKSLMPKDPQGPGMGKELGERMRMQKEAGESLKPTSTAVQAPGRISAPSPVDKVNPSGGYGSGAGEKRIDVKDMVKPLGQMHQGGKIPKTGAYIMKRDEHVLTPEDHGHLKAAMGLAHSILSHDAEPEKAPEMPKHLREMHIKELHTGGFHVTKHSGRPGDEHTTHGAPDNDSVVGHFMDHMGHPDEDEEAVEAGDHDMDGGKMAAEKALGFQK